MSKLMIPKEFLGAFKAGHRASSREFIDEEMSYRLLSKWLSEKCEESRETLEYLTKFNNEFHKNVIKKGDKEALHSSDELRKSCYARENAKNWDLMSVRKNQLAYLEDEPFHGDQNYTEENLIEAIDLRKEQEEFDRLILTT